MTSGRLFFIKIIFPLLLWVGASFGADTYPFAGLPRIFINTENSAPIVDRETEIDGFVEVQEDSASSPGDSRAISVRCRGNSSFKDMPQHSYRLHSKKAFSLLGLPPHKNWVLVTSYADRSLVRNRVAYGLAGALGAKDIPMTRYVELFINGSYEGVYLLSEAPKDVAVRAGTAESGYLVEVDIKYHSGDVVFFGKNKRPFNIHYPKAASAEQVEKVRKHIENFERFLSEDFPKADGLDDLSRWIDNEAFLRYYWIQELSKNPDYFLSSTYFAWKEGKPVRMGPVWDFDAAFGIYPKGTSYKDWRAQKNGWSAPLFRNAAFKEAARDYWKSHRATFEAMLDSIDAYGALLAPAAANNFRRWPILQDTQNRFHTGKFKSYEDAVRSLKIWYRYRMNWIDGMLK